MIAMLKIPRGWRRVRTGTVKKCDCVFARDGMELVHPFWCGHKDWDARAVGDPIESVDYVIRRIRK